MSSKDQSCMILDDAELETQAAPKKQFRGWRDEDAEQMTAARIFGSGSAGASTSNSFPQAFQNNKAKKTVAGPASRPFPFSGMRWSGAERDRQVEPAPAPVVGVHESSTSIGALISTVKHSFRIDTANEKRSGPPYSPKTPTYDDGTPYRVEDLPGI